MRHLQDTRPRGAWKEGGTGRTGALSRSMRASFLFPPPVPSLIRFPMFHPSASPPLLLVQSEPLFPLSLCFCITALLRASIVYSVVPPRACSCSVMKMEATPNWPVTVWQILRRVQALLGCSAGPRLRAARGRHFEPAAPAGQRRAPSKVRLL